jgi:hypothetical protein
MNVYPLLRKRARLAADMEAAPDTEDASHRMDALVHLDERIASLLKERQSALEAMFFPYSRMLDSRSLITAALVFDKIWFLDTFDHMAREVALTYTDYLPVPTFRDRWETLAPIYDRLQEAGIVGFYPAGPIAEDFEPYIGRNLLADTVDATMLSTRKTWALPKSQFPLASTRAQLPVCHGKYSEYPMENYIGSDIRADYDVGDQEILDHSSVIFTTERQGASIKLSQSLLAASAEGFSLFSDQPAHLALLSERLRRAPATPGEPNTDLQSRCGAVAFSILGQLLDADQLDAMSIDDVLARRERYAQARERLKEKLFELTAAVDAGDVTGASIAAVVRSKVLPELRKAQDEIGIVREKAVGELVASTVRALTAGSAGSLLSALIFPGSSIVGGLALGAGVAATSLAPSVAGLYAHFSAERRMRKSQWAYLLPLVHV